MHIQKQSERSPDSDPAGAVSLASTGSHRAPRAGEKTTTAFGRVVDWIQASHKTGRDAAVESNAAGVAGASITSRSVYDVSKLKPPELARLAEMVNLLSASPFSPWGSEFAGICSDAGIHHETLSDDQRKEIGIAFRKAIGQEHLVLDDEEIGDIARSAVRAVASIRQEPTPNRRSEGS